MFEAQHGEHERDERGFAGTAEVPGASLAAALAAPGLIDEYCLVVQPVAVGSGQALFAKLPGALRLELVEARSFECGVVVQIYRPRNG